MPQASLPPTGASVSVVALTDQRYVAAGPSCQHSQPPPSARVSSNGKRVTAPQTRKVCGPGR